MPRARTHDVITLALVAPTFLMAHHLTGSRDLAWVVTLATFFSGFLFNPDLDISSKPYARWGPLRFLWWPYQVIFRHRSRLSHGLVLGTLIRLLYFSVVLLLLSAVALFLWHGLTQQPGSQESWRQMFARTKSVLLSIDVRYWLAALFGLWWGAAAHTLADWIESLWTATKRIL